MRAASTASGAPRERAESPSHLLCSQFQGGCAGPSIGRGVLVAPSPVLQGSRGLQWLPAASHSVKYSTGVGRKAFWLAAESRLGEMTWFKVSEQMQ